MVRKCSVVIPDGPPVLIQFERDGMALVHEASSVFLMGPSECLVWQMRSHPSAPIGVLWQFDVPCHLGAALTVDGTPLLVVQYTRLS